jgi:drug/metabolite transporter (DMT)-like permease
MIFLLLGFASFASAIVTNKILLAYFPTIFFVGIRMISGGILLLGYSWGSPRLTWQHLSQQAKVLLAIPLSTTFIPSLLKAYALKNLPATKATFFGSIDPFIAALFSFIIWHERLNRNQLIGIFCGFIGTGIVLTATQSPLEASTLVSALPFYFFYSYAELAALLQVILSRYGWMLAQQTLKKEQYTAAELNGLIMLIGGIYSLVSSVFLESIFPLCLPYPSYIAFLFAYTVLIGNVFGYTIYTAYLRTYSATLVSLAGCSIPLFVQIFSWITLGETPSLNLWLAFAITFIGIFIFYSNELKKAPSA